MNKIGKLIFIIKESHFSLSNLSSFFRLLQAKIREDSIKSDFGKKFFDNHRKPTLKLYIRKEDTKSEKISFEIFFTNDNTEINLTELSEYSFNHIFEEMIVMLKSDPLQSTLWGISSKSILKSIKEESNSRLIKIWESIIRLNVEQIIFGNSIIEINGDSIKITRK
ncbi:MAG: hypothetical protein CL764_06625 [Chloroflexi bacterium]|nr:hypothetical protein [Chloroflexota bacterium]|tara:strand:- start:1129 stop:1626 length:498 start_codon:yes stop_codon:yes gene_type:complete